MNKLFPIVLALMCFGFSEDKSFYSYSTKDFSNPQIDSIMTQILKDKQYLKLSDTMQPGFVTEEEDRYCGSEYKGARAYNFVDLNNDNEDDILVFFTLESMGCRNWYSFYLASILSKNNEYELSNYIEVGSKLSQMPVYDTLQVQGSTLTIPILRYGGDIPNQIFGISDSMKVSFNNGFLDYLDNE